MGDTLWGNLQSTEAHEHALQKTTCAGGKIWISTPGCFCQYTEWRSFIWHIRFLKSSPCFIRVLQSCIQHCKDCMRHGWRTFADSFLIISEVFFNLFHIGYFMQRIGKQIYIGLFYFFTMIRSMFLRNTIAHFQYWNIFFYIYPIFVYALP